MTRPVLPTLERIDADDFVRECWWPARGEHATFIGPTGCGKTTLGMQLLAKHTSADRVRGVALVIKPDKGPRRGKWGRRTSGDPTVTRLTSGLGGKTIREWPPPWRAAQQEPAFWSYWPTHTMNPYEDIPRHADLFRSALLDVYKRGDHALFSDEIVGLSKDLNLKLEFDTLYRQGRSMGLSLYGSTQRPAHAPMGIYGEASHFFIWRSRDAGQYDRLKEIGNVDPKLITSTLSRLRKHDCLYLYPPENIMCVVV